MNMTFLQGVVFLKKNKMGFMLYPVFLVCFELIGQRELTHFI